MNTGVSFPLLVSSSISFFDVWSFNCRYLYLWLVSYTRSLVYLLRSNYELIFSSASILLEHSKAPCLYLLLLYSATLLEVCSLPRNFLTYNSVMGSPCLCLCIHGYWYTINNSKVWNQPWCSFRNEWIEKDVHTSNGILLSHIGEWIELKILT